MTATNQGSKMGGLKQISGETPVFHPFSPCQETDSPPRNRGRPWTFPSRTLHRTTPPGAGKTPSKVEECNEGDMDFCSKCLSFEMTSQYLNYICFIVLLYFVS